MNKNQIVPQKFDDVVFENENLLIKKVCFWEKCHLSRCGKKYVLKFKLLDGKAVNIAYGGIDALLNGTGAVETEFSDVQFYRDRLAKVSIEGKGYGFINEELELVTPLKYHSAHDFQNGFAVVYIKNKETNEKKLLFLDKEGKEHFFEKNYEVISDNSDGMFMVSDSKIPNDNLAYYSEYSEHAGIWGFADSSGKEIIKPQYIYAINFENGLALVCKGKWTKDKKWDNKYKTGGYWTETELWGMIDKTGKEIIPCKFDEIRNPSNYYTYDYIWAHYGGWKEGKWGIINNSGEWVVEPIFEDYGYEISADGLFTFYNEDKWNDPDNIPMGIFSIKEKKVLFEPQFINVKFLDSETILVEVYDKKLERNIQKLIDLTGKPLFDSQYVNIYQRDNLYEVSIHENEGKWLTGLVDKKGKVILPCKHKIKFHGIHFDQKLVIFEENDKYGVVNFDDEIIIPAQHSYIDIIKNNFIRVYFGGTKDYSDGKCGLFTLDGKTIMQIEYNYISVWEDFFVAKNDSGATLYKIFHKEKA